MMMTSTLSIRPLQPNNELTIKKMCDQFHEPASIQEETTTAFVIDVFGNE